MNKYVHNDLARVFSKNLPIGKFELKLKILENKLEHMNTVETRLNKFGFFTRN